MTDAPGPPDPGPPDPDAGDNPAPDAWWRSGVLYQIYPRSFGDANGDGIGDLPGVRRHLDHLSWLGVDGIWLSPVNVSPKADWGYDVADYCDVDPDYGTLADLDGLIDDARKRGIAVLLDLVPNHTSDRHPWFAASRASRAGAQRDWYVWRDPGPGGAPPNNWVSTFGGPAWELDEATGQCYLHNFLAEQPDLNWWHEGVRRAFDDVLRFWFDRGVAGFRIDVCNMVIKDAELRDNPTAGDGDPLVERLFGQRWVYNGNRPEVHEVIRRWRRLADEAGPGRLLLGETNVEELERMVRYYGDGVDELHLAFNFPFIEAPLEAGPMRRIVEATEALLPPGAWPAWTGSNHDVSRLATRWGGGDPSRVRCALMILLGLRGTPVLYQGDEIGLVDGTVGRPQLQDPVGQRFGPPFGRDPERTPMPWHGGPGGGFTEPGVPPWLPMADPAACNVADQRDDPTSVLRLTRDLVALRRRLPQLAGGDYRSLPTTGGLWAWRRGDGVTVAVNLSEGPATLEGAGGRVAVGTDRSRDGTAVEAPFTLGPWEGAVVVDEGSE